MPFGGLPKFAFVVYYEDIPVTTDVIRTTSILGHETLAYSDFFKKNGDRIGGKDVRVRWEHDHRLYPAIVAVLNDQESVCLAAEKKYISNADPKTQIVRKSRSSRNIQKPARYREEHDSSDSDDTDGEVQPSKKKKLKKMTKEAAAKKVQTMMKEKTKIENKEHESSDSDDSNGEIQPKKKKLKKMTKEAAAKKVKTMIEEKTKTETKSVAATQKNRVALKLFDTGNDDDDDEETSSDSDSSDCLNMSRSELESKVKLLMFKNRNLKRRNTRLLDVLTATSDLKKIVLELKAATSSKSAPSRPSTAFPNATPSRPVPVPKVTSSFPPRAAPHVTPSRMKPASTSISAIPVCAVKIDRPPSTPASTSIPTIPNCEVKVDRPSTSTIPDCAVEVDKPSTSVSTSISTIPPVCAFQVDKPSTSASTSISTIPPVFAVQVDKPSRQVLTSTPRPDCASTASASNSSLLERPSRPASAPSTSACAVPFVEGSAVFTPAVSNNTTSEINEQVIHAPSGDIRVSKEAWDMLMNQTSISRFCGDLTEAVFGRTYCRTHSLTGKKAPKATTGPVKPAADKKIIQCIKEVTESRFPGHTCKPAYFTSKFNNANREETKKK